MFYSQFILAKKGPLGTIWIAAHLERKLRKNQVADTDIGVSVDSILFPDVPIALRLSSHLLLGVVRIYSRKVNYLFDDCSEALLKVKQAFRSTAVDLPPEQSKAPYHSITLPETFDLDDFELPDSEIFQGNYVDHHVSTREQITLQDTMEGVTFQTSQFGPDERFGDGDASQIGLDLEEDLFLEKEEPAGTSEKPDNKAADPEPPPKQAMPLIGYEQNEGVSDLPSASPNNYSSIQAPSTPGLMEEPNVNAQEALISDDHMDDDQNCIDMASKEVSGTASNQVDPCSMHSIAFKSNGDCCYLDTQEISKERSEIAAYSNEAVEPTSGNAQPLKFNEHIEAMSNMGCSGNKITSSALQNVRDVPGDIQSERHSDHPNEVAINGVEMPLVGNGMTTEVDGLSSSDGCGKRDLNGIHLPISDHKSGDKISFIAQGALSTQENGEIVQICGSDCQDRSQNLETSKTLESGDKKPSAFSTVGLQACKSRFLSNRDGVENMANHSSLLFEDDGRRSLGVSDKESLTNVSEISTDSQDPTKSNLKAVQISHEATCADNSNLDGPLEMISSGDHLEKDNGFGGSEFSAPEKLLSVPILPATEAGDPLIECTPGKEVLAEGADGSGEKLISGKKRSFSESTLTIQSLNSESSGAPQSKQAVDYIPEDNDLLSSILGGKRSTGLKMKATPVTDNRPIKQQRVSVRSSSHKRKLLVDDTMVLHGDTIRDQLTNIEDIQRVRKKAPCTRHEVWLLQKQFLEDEIFHEPVFTGVSSDFRSLHNETFDLTGVKIVRSDGRKSADETLTPFPTGGGGRQEERGTLEGNRQESTFVVDGSILQKELETFDYEVAKQVSQNNGSREKAETKENDGIIQSGGEEDQSLASRLEPSLSAIPSEVNLATDTNADMLYRGNSSGGVVSVDIDASQLLDQGDHVVSTMDGVSVVEDVSGSGREGREVVDTSEKFVSGEKSDEKSLSERIEGVDTTNTVVVAADLGDSFDLHVCDAVTDSMSVDNRSSPILDKVAEEYQLSEQSAHKNVVAVTDSVLGEGRASPTLDKVTEECQLSEPKFASLDENVASDLRREYSCTTLNDNLVEDMKLDSSSFEADLGSRNTQMGERENLDCWEGGSKSAMESRAVPAESFYPTEHADIWVDAAIEHDTDFLIVDDDEVVDDHENDMPNSGEKRILDNSGWSTRTRAVANYLQVLFDKEVYHAEKVISLDNLLAGKSRKEASRLFFETLVLKTKDYVHAEQASSFSDIKIKPAGKLMRSDFVSHTNSRTLG